MKVNTKLAEFNTESFFNYSEHLDREVELGEVQLAIKKLSKNKAVGIDGIMNEVFIFGGEVAAKNLQILFNYIFVNESFPTSWSQGLIFPLLKADQVNINLS